MALSEIAFSRGTCEENRAEKRLGRRVATVLSIHRVPTHLFGPTTAAQKYKTDT